MGLIMGMIVAGATGYVDPTNIKTSPAITFLWVKRFKLGVYGPAILPSMAVYVVLAMEAIGDITASSEVSKVEVDGVSRSDECRLMTSLSSTLESREGYWQTAWQGSSPHCSP